ncbi:hypothetical protein FVD15_04065 [Campylobacter volucris]|uniref:Uncharacterized protein n=1 Tax=Campylobacter volucris TaxID=1031542 RepID=A0AAE5YHT4_9BACT|nr:hypothetical protein [Campylobacter volucris]AJC94737.1 hypothetical protein CVOL_1443 [Campylobacter volucris LMG 24379]KAB0579368.1 hypothetical protein F7P61_04415 [Campylobacter volucris]MBF7046624.1 hypothetical protein [Campylobacter volucris]MBF7049706.1 hypothetical protein [Campylobacter volucris]MBF7060139.1 hypothetical protein [Campylobacter volucris]
MSFKKEHKELKVIIEKIYNEQSLESSCDDIVEKLITIYKTEYKHKYSELTTIILNITKSDREQDLMTLAQNVRMLEEKLDNKTCDECIKEKIKDFYDHINLECVRLQDSDGKIKKIKDEYNELYKNYNNIKDNLSKQQTQYITILGIFASIVLTFVSGLVFSTSVLSNIDKVSIFRLIFTMAFIAFFVGNILYSLFAFLLKISSIYSCKSNIYIYVFNLIIFLIMLIDFCFYLYCFY